VVQAQIGGSEVNDEMRVVFIKAQITCAEAELFGMQAANAEARLNGDKMPYGISDFTAVPIKFGITHNQVIGYLTGR
jgi:hypothetical protein